MKKSKQVIKGIYTIKSLDTNKIYVGKANDIYSRWEGHKRQLNKGTHVNSKLQKDWDKYGSHRFEFAILHRWHRGESLSESEEIWIGHLKPQYNIIQGKRA